MRKLSFGVASSLDNFLSRPDGGVDWLLWNEEVMALIGDFWKSIDTILMGRKTYEVAQQQQGGSSSSPGIPTYVFSRTLPAGPAGGVEVVGGDAAAFVRELKGREGEGICLMGGGELARSLFEAGLIDEVSLNVHPVLLGSGIPVFLPMARQVDLELVECKPLKTGCVYVLYRVKP